MLAVIVTIQLYLTASVSKGAAEQSADSGVVKTFPKGCRPGLYHQPNGPFTVMVFCEDALGSYIAVICQDAGKCENFRRPNDDHGPWELDDRIWQAKPWAADVLSFAWSADGKSLYVSTSQIYGTGGLFQLDLERRTAHQILPSNKPASSEDPGPGYLIVSIDENKKILNYSVGIDEHSVRGSIPLAVP